jgi:hypothetical protein
MPLLSHSNKNQNKRTKNIPATSFANDVARLRAFNQNYQACYLFLIIIKLKIITR